jgi:hypothetical protein
MQKCELEKAVAFPSRIAMCGDEGLQQGSEIASAGKPRGSRARRWRN